jgi:hypothetical protein
MTYEELWVKYRDLVIDSEEEKARLLYLYRQEMITNAQLHSELEKERSLTDSLLYGKPVDKLRMTPSN